MGGSFLENRRQVAVALLLAAALLVGVALRYAAGSRALPPPAVVQGGSGATGQQEIVVHVVGAVERPGIYRLPSGSRVADVVERAGPKFTADVDALNLAARLNDGQKVVVPERRPPGASGPTPQGAGASNSFQAPSSGDRKININTADQAELDRLPGIGPALAQRIIQYRETHGPFAAPEDLKRVPGIGDRKFEALKDMITVY
jgi:competence protein ComEA